jgi:hypothetical protein
MLERREVKRIVLWIIKPLDRIDHSNRIALAAAFVAIVFFLAGGPRRPLLQILVG